MKVCKAAWPLWLWLAAMLVLAAAGFERHGVTGKPYMSPSRVTR